jgi:hypothetical protein
MEVKLADPKFLVQSLVSGMQKVYQALAISLCKSLRNVWVPGHQMGKAHGHIGLEVNFVQKILVLIS